MFSIALLIALMCAVTPAGAGDGLADALHDLASGRWHRAIPKLEALAGEGNAVAQYRLGTLYYEGRSVPKDEMLAIYWWQEAAAQGDTESMVRLGSAYLANPHVARTVPDAQRDAALWYFQAASAGRVEAQYQLGLLFLAGRGVATDRVEAARWFHEAARQGHAKARQMLSSLAAGQ